MWWYSIYKQNDILGKTYAPFTYFSWSFYLINQGTSHWTESCWSLVTPNSYQIWEKWTYAITIGVTHWQYSFIYYWTILSIWIKTRITRYSFLLVPTQKYLETRWKLSIKSRLAERETSASWKWKKRQRREKELVPRSTFWKSIK